MADNKNGGDEKSNFLTSETTITNEMHKGAAAESHSLQIGDEEDEERAQLSSSAVNASSSSKTPKPPTQPRPARRKIVVIFLHDDCY
jgi:hypothetical protein